MRIQFVMEGGLAFLPARAEPLEIDSSALLPQEQAELQRLLLAARFFERATHAPHAPHAPHAHSRPDSYRYTITIEELERCHTLYLAEPIQDESLQALVRYLRRKRYTS